MNQHQDRAATGRRNTCSPNARATASGAEAAAAELVNVGLRYSRAGRQAAAEACYRQVLVAQPEHAGAHCNLGNALYAQGRSDEAVAAYRQAIRIEPDFFMAYFNLGNALRGQEKSDEAIAAYRQAIRIKPDYFEAHYNLAVALLDRGKLDQGIAACRQAIKLKPKFADAHNNLGLALTQLGQLSEGREALGKAVRLAPRNIKFQRDLGEVTHFITASPHLTALEHLARDATSLSVNDRIELHFALGKAYEDVGQHAEAFRQWLDGNALKRRQVTYDEAKTFAVLENVRSMFTPELIQAFQNIGNPSSVPVFIVGMMRSASTLVEQIFASHPQVFGGGELPYFRRAVEGVQKPLGSSVNPMELVPGMNDKVYRDLGARYLAEIARIAPQATHVTDKMPENFIFAGLIHLALPNAPIIHTVRDPVDTCVSCFSKLFIGERNYTYDLTELGRYYRHYQALMAHWHHVFPPGRILDVHYEYLVADLEGQARRIVEYCGLEWDPRCLDFHKTERPVRTASATQVRQPLYSTAIQRWRAYESFLTPLLAELGMRSK